MNWHNVLYSIKFIVFCSILAFIASCGSDGGGGGGDDITPPISLTRLTADLQTLLKAYQGDEITFEIDESGVTGNLLGFAFCTPAEPLAPPAESSTPPTTIYDCDNDVTITATTDVDLTVVTFSVIIPHAYVDFSGTILSTAFDGYLDVTNLIITVDVGLTDNGDGTYKVGVVKTIDTVYDAFDIVSDIPAVTIALMLLAPLFESMVVDQFEALLTTTVNSYLATIPNITI